MYTISQLAKKAGVNKETLRYYERTGISLPPERNTQGYRLYTEKDFELIIFIKKVQSLGFTLSEIQEILSLEDNKCSIVQSRVSDKILTIQGKIKQLKSIKRALESFPSLCDQNLDHCAFLESLEKENFFT